MVTMNGLVGLGDGLSILVVSDLGKLSRKLQQRVKALVQQGEELQRTVFKEQNVSFLEDRVLPAVDAVGGPDTKPQLDGTSPTYHYMGLINKDGNLIGLHITEELEVKGLGRIVFEYFPALVPRAEAGNTYLVKAASLMKREDLKKEDFPRGFDADKTVLPLKPAQILRTFSQHLTRSLDDFVATFTDGIGAGADQLGNDGYRKSEAGIWVPPMSAGSYDLADAAARVHARKEYMTVLPEPVHMFAKFASNTASQIPRKAAEWLFVTNYLKGGYIDTGHLRKIELRDRKQIMAEQGSITEEQLRAVRLRFNELPCVVRTKESITEAAGTRGYVAFWPIHPTR